MPLSEVLTFMAGTTSIPLVLTTFDELELERPPLAELTETLGVSLFNPSSGLLLGDVSMANVTIVDNDGTLTSTVLHCII